MGDSVCYICAVPVEICMVKGRTETVRFRHVPGLCSSVYVIVVSLPNYCRWSSDFFVMKKCQRILCLWAFRPFRKHRFGLLANFLLYLFLEIWVQQLTQNIIKEVQNIGKPCSVSVGPDIKCWPYRQKHYEAGDWYWCCFCYLLLCQILEILSAFREYQPNTNKSIAIGVLSILSAWNNKAETIRRVIYRFA